MIGDTTQSRKLQFAYDLSAALCILSWIGDTLSTYTPWIRRVLVSDTYHVRHRHITDT